MIKIAIVEDCKSDYEALYTYIKRYEQKQQNTFYIRHFSSGTDFIGRYHQDYDIVFMDIELPDANGMDLTRSIRVKDPYVIIIFVTEMAQFAIKGYEVNALDFIVKPVSYFNFVNKLEKAIQAISNRTVKKLLLTQGGDTVILLTDEIYYVEKIKNDILIHTVNGDIQTRFTITEMYEQLREHGFAKCNAGCIVNLARIESFQDTTLTVCGNQLSIARRLKKELMMTYVQYFGGMAV